MGSTPLAPRENEQVKVLSQCLRNCVDDNRLNESRCTIVCGNGCSI